MSDPRLRPLREKLQVWFQNHARDLPWRHTRDPYVIWVSEVMLQQTRVDQALPYFERFIGRFPSVEALAEAELDDVLLLWEGLGYYSRARNLHAAAREVAGSVVAEVPAEYDAFRRLPGVGDYTAAAVMSIAHNIPRAAVDGNVIRVLTRLFGIADDVTKPATKRTIAQLASDFLDPYDPGRHNEALMELGATVCKPTSPRCDVCPLADACAAYAGGNPERFPVKSRRPPVPHYDVAVGVVQNDADELLIQRRAEDGLLGGLWEFPGGKRESGESLEDTCRRELREELSIDVEVQSLIKRISHAYSHFKVTLHAYRCRVTSGKPRSREGLPIRWIAVDDLSDYAFPRANRRLIEALLAERSQRSSNNQNAVAS